MNITDYILRRGETVYGTALINPVSEIMDREGKEFRIKINRPNDFIEFNHTSDRVDGSQSFVKNGVTSSQLMAEFPCEVSLSSFVTNATDNDLRLLHDAVMGFPITLTIIVTPDGNHTVLPSPIYKFVDRSYDVLLVRYNHNWNNSGWIPITECDWSGYTMVSTPFHIGISSKFSYFNPIKYVRWVEQQPIDKYMTHRIGSTILVDGVPLCQDQEDEWCMISQN